MENFQNEPKDVPTFSREEAIRLGNSYIGLEHLLLGIFRAGRRPGCSAAELF